MQLKQIRRIEGKLHKQANAAGGFGWSSWLFFVFLRRNDNETLLGILEDLRLLVKFFLEFLANRIDLRLIKKFIRHINRG